MDPHVTCRHCAAVDYHPSESCPCRPRDPCPVVPDAVPVGTPVTHEATGQVKWCWCRACKEKIREVRQ